MTPRATFSPILPKPAPTASAAHRIRQKPNKTAMTMPMLILFIIGKPPVLCLESSDTALIIAVPRTLYDLFLASHRWGTKAQGLFCHSNFAYARFHGTEPFARTLSGSAVALAPQSPSLGHLSCICSVCTFGAPIAVPRTLYDLFLASHRWGTKAQGLFCHSNFAYVRFHGTEPLYDLFLASHRWGTKAQGLFCHSNFAYVRFHGTEPLYHNLLRLHILRMKDIELFKEVIL